MVDKFYTLSWLMKDRKRKVCGWLARGGIAVVRGSSMWADTIGGEYYCGNILWQSSLTLLFHDKLAVGFK